MNILLYVTGSISCYKTYDIVRGLVKSGHNVKVTLSDGALKFIRPELFKYLGAKEVYGPSSDFDSGENFLHIDLARWCDQFVVVPLSANTLSHLSMGITKDLGTTTFLAMDTKKTKLFFPAMNTKMLTNPIISEHIKKLKSLVGVHFFPTKSGTLACGETGEGKLLDSDDVIELIKTYPKNIRTKVKNILVVSGASLNPLDSVRYISNPASGLTGKYIAQEFLSNGHHVTVVHGGSNEELFKPLMNHPNIRVLKATTTRDFEEQVNQLFPHCDVYISSAALSDIEFPENHGKLKKKELGATIEIKKSPDILKNVLKIRKPHQKIVGFAAEKNLDDQMIKEKLNSKPVDFLVATEVSNGIQKESHLKGFSVGEANYKLYEGFNVYHHGVMSKNALAKMIYQKVIQ